MPQSKPSVLPSLRNKSGRRCTCDALTSFPERTACRPSLVVKPDTCLSINICALGADRCIIGRNKAREAFECFLILTHFLAYSLEHFDKGGAVRLFYTYEVLLLQACTHKHHEKQHLKGNSKTRSRRYLESTNGHMPYVADWSQYRTYGRRISFLVPSKCRVLSSLFRWPTAPRYRQSAFDELILSWGAPLLQSMSRISVRQMIHCRIKIQINA